MKQKTSHEKQFMNMKFKLVSSFYKTKLQLNQAEPESYSPILIDPYPILNLVSRVLVQLQLENRILLFIKIESNDTMLERMMPPLYVHRNLKINQTQQCPHHQLFQRIHASSFLGTTRTPVYNHDPHHYAEIFGIQRLGIKKDSI